MTLVVTSHRNDRPLARALAPHAEVTLLECGDVNFFGVWTDNEPIAVSVERKKIPDLIQCLHNGRLLAQLQNAATAGFDHQLLVAEGETTYDADEYLIHRRRRPQPETTYLRYHQFLYELAWYIGVPVIETRNVQETANRILILYHLLQRPPEAHSSLHTIYSEPPPQLQLLGRPSLRRRIFTQLPGVSWVRSGSMEAAFPTVSSALNATQAELASIDGIGKTTAKAIWEAVR